MSPKSARSRLTLIAALAPIAVAVLALASAPVPVPGAPTIDEALTLLREGNERFVSGDTQSPHLSPARLRATAEDGQKPFATLLACSDSRVPVERVFDRGVGDIFTVRVAGNVSDTDEIGSIEYGVDHLHTPLVVVMGHTGCGAVKAVLEGAELHGSMGALVDNIRPAVEWMRKNRPELRGAELAAAAVEANVWQSIDDLLSSSEILRTRIARSDARVVGAVYEIATGRVRLMGEHPYQERIMTAAATASQAAESSPHSPADAPPDMPPVIGHGTEPEEVEGPANHAPDHASDQPPENSPESADHADADDGAPPGED